MLLIIAMVIFFINIIFKQKSFLGKLTAISIVSVIIIQYVNSIAFNLGFPMTSGLPLPFIVGKISIIVNMALLGILLSVYKNTAVVKDKTAPVTRHSSKFITYDDGKLTINFN